MSDNPKRDKADKEFQKLQRADDGKKAMSEYEAAGIAMRANMERLRALRLARDAAAPPPAPKKRGVKAKKAPSVPLSDWLKGRQEDGRN